MVEPWLGRRLKRFWIVPVLLGVLLGAAGFYLATKRKPVYSATTSLTVGSVNFRTQSVPGFVEAAQTLASSYALTVRSAAVLAPLARTEHTTEAAIAQHVTATAVPNSTVFSISATASSKTAALRIVREAAAQARKTVASFNTTSKDASKALRTFRHFAHQVVTAQQHLAAVRKNPSTTPRQLANAQTAVAAAHALASAYSAQYQLVVTGNSPQSEARQLTIIQPALNASSDKHKFLERYAALGLAAGLVAGVLLILIIPGGRRRRATDDVAAT